MIPRSAPAPRTPFTRRRMAMILVAWIALVAAAGAHLSGCRKPRIYIGLMYCQVANWNESCHLRRLETDKPRPAAEDEAVWLGLFQGMVRDEETARLLRRLHGDRRLEFTLADPAEAATNDSMDAAPGKGYDMALRVADFKIRKQGDFASAAFVSSRVISIQAAGPLGDPKALPNHGEALRLAMEDYLIRHAPGWTVREGPYGEGEVLPSGVDDQRRDLEVRIREYSAKMKALVTPGGSW